MMDYRDSDIFRQLVADGLANGTAIPNANGMIARPGKGAAGIGADDQGEEPGRPLAGLRKGGERAPIGMGKSAQPEGRASVQEYVGSADRVDPRNSDGDSFSGWNNAFRVHTNPDMTGMAMRQTTRRKTRVVSLMIIDGGKR